MSGLAILHDPHFLPLSTLLPLPLAALCHMCLFSVPQMCRVCSYPALAIPSFRQGLLLAHELCTP